MLKKNISNSLKLLKYYKFINYNLIYNNKAINRYKKDNFEISDDKFKALESLKNSIENIPISMRRQVLMKMQKVCLLLEELEYY